MNQMVCCMCGDVGFPEKLFSCKRCCFRFQHEYCSNYYGSSSSSSHVKTEICDWCQSKQGATSKSSSTRSGVEVVACRKLRSEYSCDNIKQHQVVAAVKNPSPRTRRYKLLKDVMYC